MSPSSSGCFAARRYAFTLSLALQCFALSLARDGRADECHDEVCTAVPPHYVRGQCDAIAGAPPDAARPSGTILLGYAHRAGVRLVEWDVASSRQVRLASLGGPRGAEADVAVARRAGGLAVVITERGPGGNARLVLLDDRFRITSSRRLGAGRNPAIVARGDELFVAWLSTNERLSVVRLDARDGSERARGEVKLPERALAFPGVSVAATEEAVLVVVLTEGPLLLFGAMPALAAFSSARLDGKDGALLLDGEVPHLLLRERDGAIVDSVVHADLSLADERTVDADLAPVGITGAFGPDHTLALPSGLSVPGGRRPTSHLLVERLLWVGGRVVTLETSWELPTLVVTHAP